MVNRLLAQFRRSYFVVKPVVLFFHFLSKGINYFSQRRFGEAVEFAITPNFFNKDFDLEGIRPVLIADEEIIEEFVKDIESLGRKLSRLPFLSPLSVFTAEEYLKVKELAKHDFVRKAKILQKVFNLYQKLEDNPSNFQKNFLSIKFCLRQINPSLNPKDQAEVAEQIGEILKKTVQGYKSRSTNVKKLYFTSQLWQQRFDQNNKFIQSDSDRFFWSMTLAGVQTAYPGSRNQELSHLWRELVMFEYISQLAECRGGREMSSWIESEIDELMDFQNSNARNESDQAKDKVERPFCERPFRQISLTCEGDAFFCCWQQTPDVSIGNLVNSSIEEVWHSEVAHETRKQILAGKMPKICKDITGCPYHFTELKPSYHVFDLAQPTFLDINLPNFFCNIGGYRPSEKTPACIMCERSQKDYRFQDDKYFDGILKDLAKIMPGVNALHIQGVSEAFWKGAIFDILNKLDFDKYAEGITVATTTNGTVFTPERQDEFLKRCPDSLVSLSIDASTSATYRKIRRLNMYDKIIEHAHRYGHKRNPLKQRFRIQNNINLLNLHEVVDMVRAAKYVNADQIELNPTGGGGDIAEILVNPENAHLFAEAQAAAENEAAQIGIDILILRPLDMGYTKAKQSTPKLL